MWRAYEKSFRAATAAQRGLANSGQRAAAQRSFNKGSRSAQRGIVGPWDAPPPPEVGGYLDFSGVAIPSDITNGADFPLGRYVLPKHPWRSKDPIGLSASAANAHTVVLGPTTAGKTSSIIAPWIYSAMQFGYLVVAIDVKGGGDLLAKVDQYRVSQDPTVALQARTFDYNSPMSSISWNWLKELDEESAVNAAAEAICGKDRDNDPNREFRLRDLKWMRGILELASATRVSWTVEDLLVLLNDQRRMEDLIGRFGNPRVVGRLGDLVGMDAQDYARSVQFVTTYLEVLNTSGFVEVTRRSDQTLDALDADGGLVIVSAPIADGKLAEAASGIFLSLFLNRRFKKFGAAPRPVLLVLDEAPRLRDRIDLPSLLSLSAGAGVSVVLAVQEVHDLREDERDVIFANCANLILMAGAGHKTTEYVSSRLGRRIAVKKTRSTSHALREGRVVQSGFENAEVPVLGHSELASPPGGQYGATVHSYSLSRKPIIVDLTRSDLLTN